MALSIGSRFTSAILLVTALLTAAGRVHAAAEQPISVTAVSGTFFANASNSGEFTAGPATPVTFTQEFSGLNFNPPSGTIPCSNATGVTTTTHPFTNVVPQTDGTCKTVPVQGNNQTAGVGDLTAFQAVFTGSFVVSTPGRITFNINSDDGWILSIGSTPSGAQPAHVTGQLLNFPKAGPFTGYTIVGSYNLISPPNQNDLVVNFPAAGTYPFEFDYSECCEGDLSFTVKANGAPIPPAPQLVLDVRGLTDAARVQGLQHVEVLVGTGHAQQVELLVDDQSKGVKRTPPYTFDWDTSQESVGRHKVVLRGQDSTGGITNKELTLEVLAAAPAAPRATSLPTPVVAAPLTPRPEDSSEPLIGIVLLLVFAGLVAFFVVRGLREPVVVTAEPTPAPVAPPPTFNDDTEDLHNVALSDLTVVSQHRAPQALPTAKLLFKPDKEVPLSRTIETTIGRDTASTAFIDDQRVSRRHARITCRNGDFWIEDVGSANGTIVNGARIQEKQTRKLENNDQIGVGDTNIIFTVEPG